MFHKHDIVLDYKRAVQDVTRVGDAADGSYPADVLAVINKNKELFFYEEDGGSTNRFRVKIHYEHVEDGFLRLCKRMEGYDQMPKRTVVGVMMKTDLDTDPDTDSDDDAHAVAARGVCVDMAAAGGYVVHGRNSWGPKVPTIEVDAGNYLYHVEFVVEIEKIWNVNGLPRPNPAYTRRFLAAQKTEAKAETEKQRQEANEAKMKKLEKTITKQTKTFKTLGAEKKKMQEEVARQAAHSTSLLQHQKVIETEIKEQTQMIEKLKAQMQVDVARQFAHGTSLRGVLQELNKMVEVFKSPTLNDLVSLT